MYRGTALAGPQNNQGFEPGNRHMVLVFIGEYGSQYDWERATRIAADQGWLDIEFDKAGRVTAEQVAGQDHTLRQCYADASQSGECMIAYASRE